MNFLNISSNKKVICVVTLSKTAKTSLQKEQHRQKHRSRHSGNDIDNSTLKEYGKSISVQKACSGFGESIDHVSDVDALETLFLRFSFRCHVTVVLSFKK